MTWDDVRPEEQEHVYLALLRELRRVRELADESGSLGLSALRAEADGSSEALVAALKVLGWTADRMPVDRDEGGRWVLRDEEQGE